MLIRFLPIPLLRPSDLHLLVEKIGARLILAPIVRLYMMSNTHVSAFLGISRIMLFLDLTDRYKPTFLNTFTLEFWAYYIV